VHVPASNGVNVVPETLQMDGVVVAKTTGRPDEAVAVIATPAPFTVGEEGVANVIV
jgi:hypothetical protein